MRVPRRLVPVGYRQVLLIVVTAGRLDAGASIEAGEAAVVNPVGGTQSRGIALAAEDSGTRFFAAVIGEAVPDGSGGGEVVSSEPNGDIGETGTGRIIVLTELCPVGVTAAEAAYTADGDPCFGGEPVESMVVIATNLTTGEHFTVEADGNGTVVLEDAPAGEYDLIIDGGPQYGETVGVCGGQDQSADLPVLPFTASVVSLTLPAGKEYLCVTRTVQQPGAEPVASVTLSVVFYACPVGMTFAELDRTQCDLVFDGFDAGFQGDLNDLSLANADFDGVSYIWSGLELNAGTLYSIAVFSYPAGYDWYAYGVEGGPLQEPHAGGFVLSPDDPTIGIEIFFISQ